MAMRIQKFSDRIDGKESIIDINKNGLEILSDDGGTLYRLTMENGKLMVVTGGFCEHENQQLDDVLLVQPLASKKVALERRVYVSNELEKAQAEV